MRKECITGKLHAVTVRMKKHPQSLKLVQFSLGATHSVGWSQDGDLAKINDGYVAGSGELVIYQGVCAWRT